MTFPHVSSYVQTRKTDVRLQNKLLGCRLVTRGVGKSREKERVNCTFYCRTTATLAESLSYFCTCFLFSLPNLIWGLIPMERDDSQLRKAHAVEGSGGTHALTHTQQRIVSATITAKLLLLGATCLTPFFFFALSLTVVACLAGKKKGIDSSSIPMAH